MGYTVMRDDISRCCHDHKTLQRAEMVEFFATSDEHETTGLPIAKDVTGPLGAYLKTSYEYREIMLREKGAGFPKRWTDDHEELGYVRKVGEWWTKAPWWNGVRYGKDKYAAWMKAPTN